MTLSGGLEVLNVSFKKTQVSGYVHAYLKWELMIGNESSTSRKEFQG